MPRKSPSTVDINGFALAVIREARGRSVASLAAELPGQKGEKGCDRSYLNHIENGTKTRVSAAFYNALLLELRIPDYRTLLANPHTPAEQVSA